ncbi:MAG: hypothetical protein ACRDX8_00895 [Acidimicrobiales bacterium]
MITVFRRDGIWPPLLASVVLVGCLSGRQRTDAITNRFLKTCEIVEDLPQRLARRAAYLRGSARRGSAVDALVIAMAEPGGSVLSSDMGDLRALAAHADDVVVLKV